MKRLPLLSLFRAALLALVPGYLAYRTHLGVFLVAATIFGLLFLLALFAPERYRPVENFLSSLQRLTTQGLSWVILAALFFLVLTPVSLIRRLFQGKGNRSVVSYWKPAPKATSMAGQH